VSAKVIAGIGVAMKEPPKPPTKNLAAPEPASGGADWKRFLPWILLAGTALLLVVVVGSVALYVIFRAAQPASDDEKTVLENLEKNYDAKHKLDEKSRVVRLELEGPHVDDEAINEVVKLKFLKELSLAKSSVTDAGMQKIRELRRLDQLGITNTHVTDQGLRHLEKMPSLRHVWVCETERLTKPGIAALKKTLPGVTVHVMGAAKK
jgi:hypothetical protein